jgi:hypothetical protein
MKEIEIDTNCIGKRFQKWCRIVHLLHLLHLLHLFTSFASLLALRYCQPTTFLQQWRIVKNPGCRPTTLLQQWRIAKYPSCQPTTFLQQWRVVNTLAASLRHFTQLNARFIPLLRSYTALRWCVDCKRSEAQERKKREEPLHRAYTDLCRFIYLETLASG